MSYTAKSVILDIADNHGDVNHILIRSIDFYYNGSKVTITSGFTAYATSFVDATTAPALAFNTSLSKSGSLLNTSWESSIGNVTNQRLIIVFDSSETFDFLVINNGHHNGGSTTRGANNIKITLSTDAITDTTYNAAVTNSTVFFDSVLIEHIPSNYEFGNLIIDPAVRTDISSRSVIIDIADNYSNGTVLGIRQVDFYKDQDRIDVDSGNCTVYATTQFSANFSPFYSFYSDELKVDTWTFNQWLAVSGTVANQRLIIVFDSTIDFDAIAINNAHTTGASTDAGAENVKIHTSTDAITDTTYDAAIANSTLIYDDTFDEHIAVNAEDWQILLLIEPKVDTPDISPPSGAVPSGQLITLTSANADSIYYTLNGVDPTPSDNLYSVPFAITSAVTIKAYGIAAGLDDSDVASESYTIVVAAPQPIITIQT